MKNCLIAFLLSVIFSLIIMPFLLKYFRHKNMSQTILKYVENHKGKNGTITMGGVLFIFVTLCMSFMLIDFDIGWLMCLLISVCFGVLGFMDDHIKIKYKQNLGLRAYQKIVGQVGISLIFAFFVYFVYGGKVFLLFSQRTIDFDFAIVPLIVLVLVATTNSVNLTDGIDGLASSVSFIYLVFFTAITTILSNVMYQNGETGVIIDNIANVNLLSSILCGAIIVFLLYNTSKASIFMGDVGSLFLGGYIASVACLLGLELLILVLGVCFVFSSVSVILQVASFKLRKKRIFKMSPFHHHLQLSGLSEPKIVMVYYAVTLCVGALCVVLYLV